MTPVRLEPATLRSRVKHSTTEPLCSLTGDILLSYSRMPNILYPPTLRICYCPQTVDCQIVSPTLGIYRYCYHTVKRQIYYPLTLRICYCQGCGNTMPDLSYLVPFHSEQVENFNLLVLGQVQNLCKVYKVLYFIF